MSVVVYEVDEEGELVGLPGLSRDVLGSDRVVIVVAERQRKIYLWKGKRSSVKKKFVGARKAADLRAEWGLTFKVVAVDEGEEDSDFLGLIGAKAEAPARREKKAAEAAEARAQPARAQPAVEPVVEAREQVRAQPAVEPAVEARAQPVRVQPAVEPAVEAREQVRVQPAVEQVRVQPAVEPAVEARAQPVRVQPAREQVRAQPAVEQVRAQPAVEQVRVQGGGQLFGGFSEEFVLSKLSEVGVPEGYVREMVVVGPCVYVVKEVRSSIFGRESVERRLERVEPPEGVFVVEDFVTRVIVDGGRVVAVEFLREDKGRGVDVLKSEMVKHLEDIISAFRGG